MRKSYLLITGVIFLLWSFFPVFFQRPLTPELVLIFALLWLVGYWLFCHSIIMAFAPHHTGRKREWSSLHLFLIAIVGALLFELMGSMLGGLWFDPFFSFGLSLIFLSLFLAFYFFVLLKGYIAAQALIRHYFKPQPKRHISRQQFAPFFWAIGIFGLIGLILTIHDAILTSLTLSANTYPSMLLQNPFSPSDLVGVLLSCYAILEFLEFEHREDSFLLHLLEGDWQPSVILIISCIVALTFQPFVMPLVVFVYRQWPVLGMDEAHLTWPILLLWPIQYLLLLSFYRFIYKKETVHIWE